MTKIEDFITRKSIDRKISAYLFNPNNYDGWLKGQSFIRALGFNPNDPEHVSMLAKQIRFDPYSAIFSKDTKWGARFRQKLAIIGPNGKIIDGVRSVWQKDYNNGTITLITLLPPKRRR